jgi:hypothetical protein
MTGFKRRLDWFVEHRPDLTRNVARMEIQRRGERRMMSIITRDQLRQVLRVMLDEREFLSPFGIRSVSRRHLDEPYILRVNGTASAVNYEPAESSTSLFGGNSNWRGPIWFPVNYLIIESLRNFTLPGDEYQVSVPPVRA